MNTQQAYEPEDKVEVTGRPMWQVSLMASIQRGQKDLSGVACAYLSRSRRVTTSAASVAPT